MSDGVFTREAGGSPLLLSIPHDGRRLPDEVAERMTEAGLAIPDTDWHVCQLYGFARELGATVISAQYSRYLVDLNRPADDAAMYDKQVSTGLCPLRTFDGEPIYRLGGVDDEERAARVARYWQPYHAALMVELAYLKERHGYALLWDAHSIVSEVPALFDDELPVLNLGTFNGQSCAQEFATALSEVVTEAPYSSVVNGRFTGGYITRHYGDPRNDVHAVQLELAQRSYMDENTLRYDAERADGLLPHVQRLLQTYLDVGQQIYG